ncbi:MAG: flagellar basal body rod protein FlgC [Alphaproteobacteria bacterium]|nr:flagellar basal body rod protein FlgC [Alphaproteobacteria bacterium]
MDLEQTLAIAASGLSAQGKRVRVIAENIANADSVAASPNGKPYQRKTITFENVLDRATGAELVKVKRIAPDRSPPIKRYEPGHPVADANGYVLTPNVDRLVEVMDAREAQRGYEANLQIIDAARHMASRTVDLLR